jgi:DNA-directed RNA polymerase subunit N (RpoN/RPB10)
MEIPYRCASCGQTNEVFLEPVHGPHQQLVEDCATCCRPMVITARWNESTGTFDVEVYQEDRD